MEIGIHDGGNRIDPLRENFAAHRRIPDDYDAAEHLHEAARPVCPSDNKPADQPADNPVTLLCEGQTDQLVKELVDLSAEAEPPLESDPQNDPRKMLAINVGHFHKHKDHTDYSTSRPNGWPIGSGITESGVKRFGK